MLNEEQLAAVEAEGAVFVSAGAGTGKTSVLVERYVRAVCDRGIDVDSILVITYTRKAAGELRTRIRAALRERGRPDLARELDGAWISTIHGFCNRLLRAHPFAAGLDPRFRELEDAGAVVLRGEAFERALDAFCADEEPERLRLLATYRADGLRRMLTGVYETLRSAGRELVLELGERPSARGGGRGPPRRGRAARRATRRRPRRSGATPARRCAWPPAGCPPEKLVDLSALLDSRRRAPRRSSRRARRRSRPRSRSSPRAIATCSRSCSSASRPSTRRRSGASRPSTSRISSSRRATSCATTSRARRDSAPLPDGHGRRVPGHEPAAVRAHRPRRASGADRGLHRRRRVPVDLRLPARRPRGLPRAPRAGREPARADAELPLAPAGARRDQPPLRRRVRRRVPAARRLGRVRRSRLRAPGRAARHGQGELRGRRASTGARARRKRIASRVRELVDSGEAEPGEIVVLFAAGTDAERYEEALRREGLPTFRATGRGYFGQQQVVDLLAYLRLLHNRYDDVALTTVLASPFVGVSNDALVLLRRNATRRPLFTALETGAPRGARSRATSASCAHSSSATSGSCARRSRIGLEALCDRVVCEHDYDLAVLARWDGTRRFANLRKLGRLAREYEAMRGSRHRGLRPLRPRPGRARREGARGGRGGGGRRRRAPAHDPRREGPRVQGRRRRRRGARRQRPARPGRDRRALGRPLRLPDGAPDARRPPPGLRLGRRARGRRRAGARGAAAPLLRRDDARDRPADRVGRDRSGADRRPHDADRVGARAPGRARRP